MMYSLLGLDEQTTLLNQIVDGGRRLDHPGPDPVAATTDPDPVGPDPVPEQPHPVAVRPAGRLHGTGLVRRPRRTPARRRSPTRAMSGRPSGGPRAKSRAPQANGASGRTWAPAEP